MQMDTFWYMGNSYATCGVSPIDVILWIGEQILVLKKK